MKTKSPEVRNQKITDRYALYNGDCCSVLNGLKDNSIGFSVFSPPFAELYTYSDDAADLANNLTYQEFFTHFDYLVGELFRVMMPGRVVAVHCMERTTHKKNGEEIGLKDFPGDIIRSFVKYNFSFHSRHCIWKDPLTAAVRTRAIGLAHKQIVKDSSLCRMGLADYILTFRKPGENPIPIKHPRGLTVYYGARTVPRNLEHFIGSDDPRTNKRSHWIWQQYASPVWTDIRQMRVLPYKGAKEEDDEKHICPLQLDVIERCLVLWSTKNDIVLSPFMGVGSEVYVAVKNGRRGVGVELKPRYFRQAVRNLESLNQRKNFKE